MIHVVLCQPEIPQNTGNIMRTCVGTDVRLHLIKPLGFEIDDRKLRRSAVDYYDSLYFEIHETWDEFYQNHPGRYFFLTRYGKHTVKPILQKSKKIFILYLVVSLMVLIENYLQNI
jgi:tRNA (cytidine/uridine-2'-O-)-methyltransferase